MIAPQTTPDAHGCSRFINELTCISPEAYWVDAPENTRPLQAERGAERVRKEGRPLATTGGHLSECNIRVSVLEMQSA
ncbi:hypothetical protein FA13DRAFT_1735261 [Coprinellus micaceus]|uniref:Uncharacterized protein n=1 Tax=Coprinellus micaceus TaxID=71717 RepID=A0A4Y7T5B5_COPMI|nr:hypothetical protein FA13DRAFT_1735261 [Coprinellus micaceus]